MDYTKEQIEEVVKKFSLTPKEIAEITKTVIGVLASDKIASDHPLSIIVGGQSGSGKTALINYTTFISSYREFITIDNDFFRGFHPKVTEIRTKYPGLYTKATDQLGLGITSNVISYLMGNDIKLDDGTTFKNPSHLRYDLIFHQTLKSNRIADDAMVKLKNAGYTVGVRAFAVSYLESKMSQIERCKAQFESTGSCRHVPPQEHLTAIDGLPKTVEYIEENGRADFVEIFRRGEDIDKPVSIYTRFNPQTKQQTLKVIRDCERAPHADNLNGFENAQEAVIKTREQDAKQCSQTLQQRIYQAKSDGGYEIPGMAEHIDELQSAFNQYLKECPCQQ